MSHNHNRSMLIEGRQVCSCICSISNHTCLCPLRTNQESSSITTKIIMSNYCTNHRQRRQICNSNNTNSSNNTSTKPIGTRQLVAMEPTTTTKTTRGNRSNGNRVLVNHNLKQQQQTTKSNHILVSSQLLFFVGLLTTCLLLLDSNPFALAALQPTLNNQQVIPSFSNGLISASSSMSSSLGPSLCPLVSSCHCKWSGGKQGATCDRRNLAHIPSQLPVDTQVLDMTGNNLQHLPGHIFQDKHLTNLQKLFLSDCKISFIADEAFAQLTNLVELDLSHNNLQFIPSAKALRPIQYSLRRLIMSYNPIQTIESDSFGALINLNTLDISNCQLSQLKANSFAGLQQLKELKLNDNRLTQLPMNVTNTLNEYLDVDLFSNPWHCDCDLRQSIEWINRHHIQQSMIPTCNSPARHKDIRWHNIKPEEFLCPPIVINRQHEIVVGAGSNISLACSARGSQPMTFVWFQDERNLTSPRLNQSEPPPSTKLLEEKRYEIAEDVSVPNITTSVLYLMNLKLTDTSLFLCWVENNAGYTIANFSLVVNDSPPASYIGGINSLTTSSTGGGSISGSSFLHSIGLDRGEAQAGLIGLFFLIILVAAIAILVQVLKQNYSNAAKNSKSNDLHKHSHHKATTIESLAAAKKFHQDNKSAAMDQSDEEYEYDDQADNRSATSSTVSSSFGGETAPKVLAPSDLDGFIEHMRSGIINMDYHTMSPVIQFNTNTLKQSSASNGNKVNQQTRQQVMNMSHFPSASNASSNVPYYGGGGGGTNSMATTMSDLSPSSGSGNVDFAPTQHHIRPAQQQHLANCDLQQQQQQLHYLHNHHHSDHLIVPATNTTTTSYTSDYQSGYGEPQSQQQQQHDMMSVNVPQTMFYKSAQPSDFYNGAQIYAGNGQTGFHAQMPSGGSMSMQHQHQHQHHNQQQPQQLIQIHPSDQFSVHQDSTARLRPDSGLQI